MKSLALKHIGGLGPAMSSILSTVWAFTKPASSKWGSAYLQLILQTQGFMICFPFVSQASSSDRSIGYLKQGNKLIRIEALEVPYWCSFHLNWWCLFVCFVQNILLAFSHYLNAKLCSPKQDSPLLVVEWWKAKHLINTFLGNFPPAQPGIGLFFIIIFSLRNSW